jgi:hypothetical protein
VASYRIVDQLAARLDAAGLLIKPVDQAPWIDDFELELGWRLPASFSYFVRRYTFRPFEWGPILLFGNSEADIVLNLHITARQDPAIWQATRKAGLMQFGRPETGSYDPVCFDLRISKREPPIVQLDHEEILIKDRIKTVQQIAPSFTELAESLLADSSEPVPYEL